MKHSRESLPKVDWPKRAKVGKRAISALEVAITKAFGKNNGPILMPGHTPQKELFIASPPGEGWHAKVIYFPADEKEGASYAVDVVFPDYQAMRPSPELVFYHLPGHLADNHGYTQHSSEQRTGKSVTNNAGGLHLGYSSLELLTKEFPHVAKLVSAASKRYQELTVERNKHYEEAIGRILIDDIPRKK